MNFFDSFENRLNSWVEFRNKLETNNNAIQLTIDCWNKAPISSLSCDPFDKSTWLGPWDLMESNTFCDFSKILAIYYTLVLTDKFKNSYFEIQVINDRDAQELRYILICDDFVIGYYYNMYILQEEMPSNITIQASYPMLGDFS